MSFEKFVKSRFMLCEGDDDKGFFEALTRSLDIEFQICHVAELNKQNTGGVSAFGSSLKGIRITTGFRDVLKAVLLVANNHVAGESDKLIRNALFDSGFTPPVAQGCRGYMDEKPVVILTVPMGSPGGIETLVLPAIYDKWPEAERCVDAFLESTGANAWAKGKSLDKARARAAIVGFHERDPYKGIGHLFRNGTLSLDHPCFDEIKQFLKDFDSLCSI